MKKPQPIVRKIVIVVLSVVISFIVSTLLNLIVLILAVSLIDKISIKSIYSTIYFWSEYIFGCSLAGLITFRYIQDTKMAKLLYATLALVLSIFPTAVAVIAPIAFFLFNTQGI